jgi:hypothetical protein
MDLNWGCVSTRIAIFTGDKAALKIFIIKRFNKIKSSRSPEAELHDFYNNYIKKYITLQLDLTEGKNIINVE